MKISKTALIVIVNTLVALAIVEVASYAFLRGKGIETGIFVTRNTTIEGARDGDKFNTLDPHLGYAHGRNESSVRKLSSDYTWVDGFVVYRKDATRLERPVILTLGGSTTDGVNYGHSWPEHLARIMREGGIAGTVVNGGTGGYSTNQELLKLIRDGFEFKPDLVISYSGINDRGRYSKLPHPMVHQYQLELLGAITRSAQPPLLPSTITALQTLTNSKAEGRVGYSLGVATDRSLGQQYEKNVRLMHAVSNAHGAEFIAFIQPYGYFGNTDGAMPESRGTSGYREQVVSLYNEITRLPKKLDYVRDLTGIFDGNYGVYKDDRVHVTDEGDRIIAKQIFGEIKGVLARSRRSSASKVDSVR